MKFSAANHHIWSKSLNYLAQSARNPGLSYQIPLSQSLTDLPESTLPLTVKVDGVKSLVQSGIVALAVDGRVMRW